MQIICVPGRRGTYRRFSGAPSLLATISDWLVDGNLTNVTSTDSQDTISTLKRYFDANRPRRRRRDANNFMIGVGYGRGAAEDLLGLGG